MQCISQTIANVSDNPSSTTRTVCRICRRGLNSMGTLLNFAGLGGDKMIDLGNAGDFFKHELGAKVPFHWTFQTLCGSFAMFLSDLVLTFLKTTKLLFRLDFLNNRSVRSRLALHSKVLHFLSPADIDCSMSI